MYWTGSKWLNNVQSQIYFGTMNFCCLQLYCCDICYIWKLFIVRYRYGCIHCRELGMKIMKIGTLKCYLADEGDLLTLLEHPGHPADPSEDDPRHALPHGAQPLQVVQGDHQGHARVWPALAHCPTVHCSHPPSSVEAGAWAATGVPSGDWWRNMPERGNLATSAPPHKPLGADQQVLSVVEAGTRHNKYCLKIVLRSVSLFLIIPPKQSRPDVTPI